MNHHWIIPLSAAVLTAALGLFVFRRRRGTEIGRVFTFLAFTLVLWNLNFFVLYAVGDPDLALRLTSLPRLGAMFVPSAILHLTLALHGRRARIWNWLLACDYLASAALAVASVAGLVVVGLRPVTWGYASVTGPLYNEYTLSVVVNFIGALVVLIRDYWTTDDSRLRVQLQFWLLGTGIALPLGLLNLLTAYGLPVYPMGSLGNTVWASVVAYAIVRHRLMDVDLIVSKGVAYFASGLFVIVPAFALTLWMQSRVFGAVHYDFSFALLVMFIGVGLLFPTLRLRTEAQVERAFFREKHEYRSVLISFAKSIIRILDRDRLLRELADKLTTMLHVDRVAVFMRDGSDGPYRVKPGTGMTPTEDEYRSDHPLIRVLSDTGEAVLRSEAESRAGAGWADAAMSFASNGWEVCVPLSASGNLVGFIALGRKRDRDVFSVVDLDLLGTIAAQSAIALENARLYEELHKSRDLIQRADRMSALGTLAAGVAHEIRNPLVSIQTFFQLAPARLHDEEFVTSFLSLAENEVKRIADLVNELLTFARSHREAIQEVDLDDTIDRTVKLLSPQAHTQRVQLRRIGAHELPTIRVDPDRVKQVLINIILNGIQATPDGGTVTVGARVVEQRGRYFCQIEIRDTGPGIPTAMQDDIFNPFFTTKEKGTGLGLSIAHQIISDHGGFIAVESKEGEGCGFLIHLPVPDSDYRSGANQPALAS